MTTSSIENAITALGNGLEGRLILPTDADYDEARTIVANSADKRPGVIVRVGTAGDVQRTVNAARDQGIELAVRSGGHSGAGHSATEGGIMLDLRDMNAIAIDAGARTAWVETGATSGQVIAATAAHGLVVGFGDTASVGVGGITLGGGVGYLVRKWGLAIDSLLAAEIVTADGRLLSADPETNADLFWAIRGGGGNFGVATRLKFRLHDLPAFTGGLMVLPATPDVVASFIAAAEAAPAELSTICNVMPALPLPFIPAEMHGKLVVFSMLAFAGDPAAAERAIAPFRALGPIVDMVRPAPYASMFPPEDPNFHPTAAAWTLFMNRVDGPVAKTILDALSTSSASFSAVQLRVLGGAAAQVPAGATAYAHRSSRIMANVMALYTPENRSRQEAWVDATAASLRQDDAGAYVNFLGAESAERVRAAYPGKTWDRLLAVKAKYDPDNLFRLNQNIAPAT
jgi:FAD/FMN-containing dehydrogenase